MSDRMFTIVILSLIVLLPMWFVINGLMWIHSDTGMNRSGRLMLGKKLWEARISARPLTRTHRLFLGWFFLLIGIAALCLGLRPWLRF